MSKNTKNLNLFEYVPETDGNLTFNINNCLNNNFDKIDEYAGATNDALNNKANLSLNNLNAVGQAIIDSKADKSYTNSVFKRLDTGDNLATKFATEIANYSSIYAWLDARKNAGNYEGMNIGDYFTFTINSGTVAGYSIPAQTFTARIIGFNTYKNCGDNIIGNMIYFKTDQVIDTPIKWNPTDDNNGSSTQQNPWLQSAVYAILNKVNNYRKGYSHQLGANASSLGIIDLIPVGLKNVLKQKRQLLDQRYSANGLLTYSTNWAWGDMGLLWLPNEIEVYGTQVRSNLGYGNGYWNPEAGLSIQFPYFANNCERRISYNSSGSRCDWWLSAPASGHSTGVCFVSSHGYASHATASHSTFLRAVVLLYLIF